MAKPRALDSRPCDEQDRPTSTDGEKQISLGARPGAIAIIERIGYLRVSGFTVSRWSLTDISPYGGVAQPG